MHTDRGAECGVKKVGGGPRADKTRSRLSVGAGSCCHTAGQADSPYTYSLHEPNHPYKRMRVRSRAHTRTHTHTVTRTEASTHANTHAPTHAHTHTHTHTHTCTVEHIYV